LIIDSQNVKYPISVLIRKDNPYAGQIVVAFGRMITEHSK
jgi:hypothetical protein